MATTANSSSRSSGKRERQVRIFYASLITLWLPVLFLLSAREQQVLINDLPELAAWVSTLVIVNLLPLTGWKSAPFAADLPIMVALALHFSPLETGIVAFVAAVDPSELRGRTEVILAVWNKAQISLCWFIASAAAHLIPGSSSGPLVIPAAFVSLGVDTAINYGLVGTSMSLKFGYAFSTVVRRMRIGPVVDFCLALLSWGAMGAVLATAYEPSRPWILPAFLGVTLLSRQGLMRSQMLMETRQAYESRQQAFAEVSKQIDGERTEERRLIAADLHDEVLQPIFKVLLMAQVVQAEIPSGKWTDIHRDLNDLSTAAEVAAGTARQLIGDLRRSGLGRGGLAPSLRRLVGLLAQQTGATLTAQVDEVELDGGKQLAVYQIAKEALSNAIHHSQAEAISLELTSQSDTVWLCVQDDGNGFDPYIEREGHFGIRIMQERAALLKGSLFLDSTPGEGCRITLLVPR